ncbi:MAG TPA: hypothetical protein VID75_07155 [Acidimicrobiales bacterium]|jgi:hypothetical protein
MTAPPGQATLLVNATHNPLAWLLYFTKLIVEVDGDAQPGPWGERSVFVTPGPHDVRIYFKYLMKARTGEAAVSVAASEASPVSVRYKAPRLMTNAGRIETTS